MAGSDRLLFSKRFAMRVLAIAAVLFVSATCFFLWVVYRVVWNLDEPYFQTNSGSYDCSNEITGERRYASIQFSDNGRKAQIIVAGQNVSLDFAWGGVAGDHWSNGDARLKVDPEVYISGVVDEDIGPCSRM